MKTIVVSAFTAVVALFVPASTRHGVAQPVAAQPAVVWKQTGVVQAAEAHQAAAADERFVYAIGNANVAKYDRATGERVAVSDGPAKHLNSGFLWDGKLYCAHSNYPLTPELSEIKVLDVQSMRLTTFKDFGDAGGSLTWAIRRDGHWWCNFAKYGAENAKTFLVKFDNNWNERGRWTYPPEVIRQLGRYSLSGGIWRDDRLLVTGHDDPVVFRLRLPREGTVLEYLGAEKVPFTGQGIAEDPKTGGLVGIHRGKRQVVFAAAQSAPLRLRVLSYNIHHGEGIDRKLDLQRIARVINTVEPDLVALQEVDRAVGRTKGVDQPAELGRLTRMHVVFGGNIKLQGGDYGNAVLSRFPIVSQQNQALPSFDNGEQRGVLKVEIKVRDTPVLLLATHLDYRQDNRERLASARAINELVAQAGDRLAVLAGDLNDVPQSAPLAELGKQWARANTRVLATVPVDKPSRQIDYILFRPLNHWRALDVTVLDEAIASDHRAILAVLEVIPRSGAR